MNRKLYEDLGVHPDATPAQIKSAYRKLSKKFHPDAGGERTEWDTIQHAYEVLSDPARRAKYDATGDDTHNASSGDPEHEKLVSIIGQIISGILNADPATQGDPAVVNFHSRVMRDLTTKERQMRMDLINARVKLKRIERFAGRFKRREGDDLVGDVVRSNVRQAERYVENIEEALAFHQKVTEFFQTYEYEVDPAEDKGQEPPTGSPQRSPYLFSR